MSTQTKKRDYSVHSHTASQPLLDRGSNPFRVASLIIFTEFCERLAYYGIMSSLLIFLQKKMGLGTASAASLQTVWSGVCYLTPLIGGWAADAYLGRYKAILYFISIYFVGMCGLTLSAFLYTGSGHHPKSYEMVFWFSIYLVALGTGGIKPNVCTLGAEQYNVDIPEQKKAKESFFNWFYLSINCGALIAYTIVAYLAVDVYFSWAWVIPTVSMGCAILLFMAGSSKYTVIPASGSILSLFVQIVYYSTMNRGRDSSRVEHFLDVAKQSCGGPYDDDDVQNIKMVWRLFPYLIYFIFYWMIYTQMSTLFVDQACQMNYYIGSFAFPPPTLSLFDTIIIIILIPILETYVNPWIRSRGWDFTMLKRIGLGFIFGALSMIVAAILEVARKRTGTIPGKISDCYDKSANVPLTNMSVFWQVPQYFLIGASEVMASITGLEFFFSQAPESMRSVVQGLNMVTTAFGNWATAILIAVVNANPKSPWITTDINKGHVDYYFVVLSGLMMIGFTVFLWSARTYEYVNVSESIDDQSDEGLRRKQSQAESIH